MSSLNKKIGESNFLSLERKIIIPNTDDTIGKEYFPNINMINKKVNHKFVSEKVKKEITENKYKLNKIPKDKFYNIYLNNRNIKNKKDIKNYKIIEFYPIIRSTDTLNKKNNNFKSIIRNSRYKFHSLDSLNLSKRDNKDLSIYNNSFIREKKRKKSDISQKLHLLSTSVKTNDLLISKEIEPFQKENIISDEYKGNKIKLFNQFFTPRFILRKQNNLITNNIYNKKEKNISNIIDLDSLNIKLSGLANKTFIKKLNSKNILNYKTYYKNNNKVFCNSTNRSITFNNKQNNFRSMNLSSPNSLSELNEDDIETYKKEDSTINSNLDLQCINNDIQIPKKNINFFEPDAPKNYEYIQGPIEFEYESDLASIKNTIINEGNINIACSRLKNIEFHEIQKKKTNIENDTINYYDEMEEEDTIVNKHRKYNSNSSLLSNRNEILKSDLSKTVEMKKYLNNDNKILRDNKLITFQNKCLKSQEKKKKNIIKNSTNIKTQNRNIVEININNHVNNKSFDIKNKSYFYIKKILEKPKIINFFPNKKHIQKNLMINYVSNFGKMKINKEIIFSSDNKDEMTKKYKKININLIKLEQSEITTDTKSFKLNSIDDMDNDNTEEGYKTKISEDDKSNNYLISTDNSIFKK